MAVKTANKDRTKVNLTGDWNQSTEISAEDTITVKNWCVGKEEKSFWL